MKATKSNAGGSKRGDTTALDMIAIIAAVAVVVGVFIILPALCPAQVRVKKIGCVNYLKQVGLSFRMWAGDNNDMMPMQFSTNAGGTMELVAGGAVAPHFLVMSNELKSPKHLKCPGDKRSSESVNWNNLANENLSYFVVPEADESIPNLWLSGDSNLTTNKKPVKSGLLSVNQSLELNWTAKRHWKVGNLVFTDGRVHDLLNLRLPEFATNALHAYYEATTNSSFRIAIP